MKVRLAYGDHCDERQPRMCAGRVAIVSVDHGPSFRPLTFRLSITSSVWSVIKSDPQFNEILSVGYLEGQKMGVSLRRSLTVG
jgi:hypothetical protein